ncbi:MAG TPA: tyrosine-type recombinase/integrase [Allocoleopsis sp.]
MTKIKDFPLRIGKVSIEIINNNNLRLRWSIDKKRHNLNLGKYGEDTLKLAKSKAYEINSQIIAGNTDFKEIKPARANNNNNNDAEKSLLDIWTIYYEVKISAGLKENTIESYNKLNKLIYSLGDNLVNDPYILKNYLLKITTLEQTRRALKYLKYACDYAIKRKIIKENCFNDILSELPEKTIKQPLALTQEQINIIIDNCIKHSSNNYIIDLVIFWLHTGCRPSEALGVRWSNISSDFKSITFNGSPQRITNKGITWSEGSKNYKKGGRKPKNKSRSVPLTKLLSETLKNRYYKLNPCKDDLIFANNKNNFIEYSTIKVIWSKCVKIIPGLEKTTPYNCRDTFITCQILNGVPISIIAAWCNTSPAMIENYYSDYLKLSQVVPYDPC